VVTRSTRQYCGMANNPTRERPKRDSIGRTSEGIYVLRPSTKPTHFTSAEIAKTIKDLKLGLAASSKPDSSAAGAAAEDSSQRAAKRP